MLASDWSMPNQEKWYILASPRAEFSIIKNGNDSGRRTISDTLYLNDGIPHNIVVVFKPFTYSWGYMKIWIDGKLRQELTSDIPPILIASDNSAFIGSLNGEDRYFKGFIDEVAFWNITLSRSQITELSFTPPRNIRINNTEGEAS